MDKEIYFTLINEDLTILLLTKKKKDPTILQYLTLNYNLKI